MILLFDYLTNRNAQSVLKLALHWSASNEDVTKCSTLLVLEIQVPIYNCSCNFLVICAN